MLAAYPVEALVLGVLALVVGGPIHFGAVFWGCLYGVGQAFGMWAFYAALGSGPISVVAPLAGVLNAAVPVAVGIALGERPGQAASVGVVLAIVAVMLVSREATVEGGSQFRFTPKVAWLTVFAGSAFGLDLVFLHQAPHECKLWPLMFARLAATVVIAALAASRRTLRLPRGKSMRLAGHRSAGHLRFGHPADRAAVVAAVAGQHFDFAVSGADCRTGDGDLARAGLTLAGDRHGDGHGVGSHDRRRLVPAKQ